MLVNVRLSAWCYVLVRDVPVGRESTGRMESVLVLKSCRLCVPYIGDCVGWSDTFSLDVRADYPSFGLMPC